MEWAMTHSRVSNRPTRGFSLLEFMLVMAILMTVIAIVVSGAIQLQKRNSSDITKVDLTQEARQFMDQTVKDLHHAGFPSSRMFDVATQLANPNNIAVGLVDITSNSVQFEGDVDGSGNVSEVFVQLIPAGGPCPCSLRRGAVYKPAFAAGAAPLYFTQVDNLLNPAVFTAYDFAGNNIPLPCTPVGIAPAVCADGVTTINNIKTVGLTLNLRSSNQDLTDNSFNNITLATEAKINN
jgi:type II secretory pathway pseudopilin PulG